MRTAFQRAGLVVAVAASAFVAVPATADAAASAASPTAVCGADGYSYSVVASSPVKFSSGTVAGTAYLMYSSGNGKNCVVTVKTSYTGTATFTTAQLIIQNGNTYVQGNYTSYAGPVRGSAAGKCVKYWGSINTGPDGQAAANAGGGRMSWGNCG
ncbi:spore-associated protein A [Streptomyces sp. NBC_00562]|uniref:spore-associated protein A n=1 Tax=Streptomyces sp. NBC_00562 TaxID=2975777 RepID=UPI002E81AD4C|nr:spore-associated protein A [Streptomyces sp. NBC_00562]WUC19518.1 spore-associated protein A [Streptomyces sp. NBC_00562]